MIYNSKTISIIEEKNIILIEIDIRQNYSFAPKFFVCVFAYKVNSYLHLYKERCIESYRFERYKGFQINETQLNKMKVFVENVLNIEIEKFSVY